MPDFSHKFRSMSIPLQWTLGILGVCALLLILSQVFVSVFLDDIVGKRLRESVQTSTDNIYHLTYEDLDLKLMSGSIYLYNFRLEPNTAAYDSAAKSQENPPLLGKGTVNTLEVKGISLWAYLFSNSLSIGSVLIDQPVISIDNIQNLRNSSQKKFSSVDSSLYALLAPQLSAFQLNDFKIKDGRFSVRDNHGAEDITSVRNLNLYLGDINIDSASATSGRLFITDEIEVGATGLTINMPQGFYRVKLNRFVLSSSRNQLQADSLQYIPLLPKYDFSAKKGVETDRIDLLISEIIAYDINFSRAVQTGRLYSRSLHVENTQLEVFHDKNKPFPPDRYPEFPHLAFRELAQPIKIDTIQIQNADITYIEHRKGVPEPGSVTFRNLQARLESLSNYRKDLKQGHEVTMQTQTEVMGKGLFNIYFTFYMDSPRGAHSVYGNLGQMEFSEFNPALENLAFVQIDQGVINSMEFNMKLDQEAANGSVTLNYENLSIELLQSETLEQGSGQEIKSFIANTFIVEENNSDPPLRQGEIKFERNEHKSVFNFWWKALSTGLKDSIGL